LGLRSGQPLPGALSVLLFDDRDESLVVEVLRHLLPVLTHSLVGEQESAGVQHRFPMRGIDHALAEHEIDALGIVECLGEKEVALGFTKL
jgi:hypothetical protein